MGILDAIVDLLGGARHLHRAVADGIDLAEPLRRRVQLRLERGLVGVAEHEEVIRTAELPVETRSGDVVGGGGEADAGRNGERQQAEDQQLLAPLATEEPPSPPHHGTTRGDTAARAVDESDGAHRLGVGDSNDSGPAAGAV